MSSSNTHITVVLDRSGSMHDIRDDIIGGFNMFLEHQQEDPENTTLTLVQFDTEDSYEVVYSFRPLAEVPKLTEQTYVPRASTPLLDAIGRTIVNLGNWISEQPADRKPGKIMVVFVTDGMENSSLEFSRRDVVGMLKMREERSCWQFVFLSADLDAIDEADTLGFKAGKRMAFDKNSYGVFHAFKDVSESAMIFKSQSVKEFAFKPEHRVKQKAEKKLT